LKRNNWLFGCRRISPLRGQRPPNVRECRGRGKGTGSRAEGSGGKRDGDRDGRSRSHGGGRGGVAGRRAGGREKSARAGRPGRSEPETEKDRRKNREGAHVYVYVAYDQTYAAPMAAASPPPFVTSRVQSSFGTGPAASLASPNTAIYRRRARTRSPPIPKRIPENAGPSTARSRGA